MLPLVVWGDVASWFSGVMSALAVLVAAISVRRSANAAQAAAESAKDTAMLVDIERKRFASEQEDRKASQARLITAVLGWRERSTHQGRQHEEQIVRVLNASLEPIREVVVEVSCGDPSTYPGPFGLRPGEVDLSITPGRLEFARIEPVGYGGGPLEVKVGVVISRSVQRRRDGTVTLTWMPLARPFTPTRFPEAARSRLEEYAGADGEVLLIEDDRVVGVDVGIRERYEWLIESIYRWRPSDRTSGRPQHVATEVSMEFTDARGVRWRSTGDGLTEA